MDIEVIMDAAEAVAPGLPELARRFLEAEAAQFGISLDLASVLARRAEGMPEVHLTGAADDLVLQLADQADALDEDGALMALAYVGALALMTRAELEADGPSAEYLALESTGRSAP